MTQRLNAAEALQLGKRIRQARVSKAMTLEALGASARVHHSQVSRIEKGHARLVSKNISKICRFLQISPFTEISEEQQALLSRVQRLICASPSTELVLARLVDALEELVRCSHDYQQDDKNCI